MPRNGDITNRGDLIVTFDIEFPEELSLGKKKQIGEKLINIEKYSKLNVIL